MNDIVQKALEKLQKSEAAATGARQSLEAAQTDLAAKQTDKNLIKKVEGLQKSLEAKTAAALEAKTAYDEAVKKAAEMADSGQTDSDAAGGGEATAQKNAGEKTVNVRIKHKSTGDFYYRCGLRVSKDFDTWVLLEGMVERLKADPYIVFDEAAR